MNKLPNGFMDKVEITETCWIWRGAIQSKGYGAVGAKRRIKLAHRVMWEARFGVIGTDMAIIHTCNLRSCVNTNHMRKVPLELVAREKAKLATHCRHGHERTSENTYQRSDGRRECLPCRDKRRKKSAVAA